MLFVHSESCIVLGYLELIESVVVLFLQTHCLLFKTLFLDFKVLSSLLGIQHCFLKVLVFRLVNIGYM